MRGYRRGGMGSEPTFDALLNAMKVAAAALRDHELPFALAGGLAVYARVGRHPYALAFFTLAEELGLAPQAA